MALKRDVDPSCSGTPSTSSLVLNDNKQEARFSTGKTPGPAGRMWRPTTQRMAPICQPAAKALVSFGEKN
jgi:hypothetical protein